ncbi:MAG: SMI1/KNR4 family protein [Psychrobacillus sp.]
MGINDIIQEINENEHCRVYFPKGILGNIEEGDVLPNDLLEFYNVCGGVDLFADADFEVSIVSPDKFLLANPVIVGEKCEYDISSHWYIIADLGNGNFLTIDLHPDRLGKCYDSHWDSHGIVGSSTVVAKSFTDLLMRLFESKGDSWYWYKDDFESLGDAYDGIELE